MMPAGGRAALRRLVLRRLVLRRLVLARSVPLAQDRLVAVVRSARQPAGAHPPRQVLWRRQALRIPPRRQGSALRSARGHPEVLAVAGGTSRLGCFRSSAGSPNATGSSAGSSTTTGS